MNKKIMVVDDEQPILEFMEIVLENEGYDVYTSSDGENIETKIQTLQPDLIVLDYQLPHRTGMEISKSLKSLKKTEHIPIIMISAHDYVMQQWKDFHINAFLSKPFDINDLIFTVDKCINQ